MDQPSVYSREQIVEAALELMREEGWNAVSTRAIARKLGSSTMPIYSHFRSVEELEGELRVKARSLLTEFQRRQYTEHVLLNVAFGYVAFARDEQNLFRFLYLERPEKMGPESLSDMKESFIAEFGKDSPVGMALAELETSAQKAVIQYSWIFTHGLAVLVNSGALDHYSDEVILRFLMNAGAAFHAWGVETGGDDIEAHEA
ncbi:MAG: helix-turn-helix domain-containing protein [Bacillota bacterium]